jgi:hypothetical protein
MSRKLEAFRRKVAGMSVDDRIERAMVLSGRVLDHTQFVIHLHASNRELNYSDTVGRQVPRSFAAHTFNLLRDTQQRFELLRLTALWDDPSDNRESIPTIVELVRSDAVQDELARRCAAQWQGQTVTFARDENEELTPEVRAEIEAIVQQSEASFGDEQAEKGRRSLMLAMKASDQMRTSRKLRALVDFRNSYLAHNLDALAAVVQPQDRLSVRATRTKRL